MKKILLVGILAINCMTWAQTIDVPAESKVSVGKSSLEKSKASASNAVQNTGMNEKNKLPKPYNPKANAQDDIKKLVDKARKEGKNVMIQAGGNWCIWCLRFNQYVQTTPELKSIIDENYLYYHLNYSPDNKNEKVFAQYGNPGDQLGYPVFIVLDKEGKMIHIQQSDVLEEGKGYSLEKTKAFFNQWLPKKI